MINLKTIEIKAFIPAKDFELSKAFYQDLGFTKASDSGGIAYFYFENCSFLLRDVCDAEQIMPYMIHLLVEDAHSWHQQIHLSGIQDKYSSNVSEIKKQPWKMLDFWFSDPSGVQWFIGQNIES